MGYDKKNKLAVKKYQQTEKGRLNHLKRSKKWYGTIRGHLCITFSNMKRRCNNPTSSPYENYGGKVCEQYIPSDPCPNCQ